MTKFFAATLLATTQLPLLSFAWVPAHTAPYNTLPKTLEFAEKAWFFPKAEAHSSITSPRRLPEEHQHRMLPWTHQHHSTLLSRTSGGNDFYFFDGFPGSAREWPTHQVSRPKKATSELQMTQKDELLTDADFYNDDTGAFVSWVSEPSSPASKACDHHFFDDAGRSTCWTSALLSAKNSLEKMKPVAPPKVDRLTDFVETCENHYYDGTGDLLCWVSQ